MYLFFVYVSTCYAEFSACPAHEVSLYSGRRTKIELFAVSKLHLFFLKFLFLWLAYFAKGIILNLFNGGIMTPSKRKSINPLNLTHTLSVFPISETGAFDCPPIKKYFGFALYPNMTIDREAQHE